MKIIDFNFIFVVVGLNILIGLEIVVEIYFLLIFFIIEKFVNEIYLIIKFLNLEIDM